MIVGDSVELKNRFGTIDFPSHQTLKSFNENLGKEIINNIFNVLIITNLEKIHRTEDRGPRDLVTDVAKKRL